MDVPQDYDAGNPLQIGFDFNKMPGAIVDKFCYGCTLIESDLQQ